MDSYLARYLMDSIEQQSMPRSKERNMRGEIRSGDTIKAPDGKQYPVAYVDGDELGVQTIPVKTFKLADCALVRACKDYEHHGGYDPNVDGIRNGTSAYESIFKNAAKP